MSVLNGNVELFTFEVTGANANFRVVSMVGNETLSQPYWYDLTLASEDPDIEFPTIIGKPGVISIYGADGVERYVHGVVAHVEQDDPKGRFTLYRLMLVPQIALLAYRRNSRIFQNLSVSEIITTIFNDAGIPSDLFQFTFRHNYEPIEYCVQYRESNLNFVSRLMEEEGIFYYFKHDAESHIMIIGDDVSIHQTIPEPANVPFHANEGGLVSERDVINKFNYREALKTGNVMIRDFDFTRPMLTLQAARQAEQYDDYESYDYPGEFVDEKRGTRLSKVRLEMHQAATKTVKAASNCKRLMPGFRFNLQKHIRTTLNAEYLVTSVTTKCSQPQVLEEGAGSEGSSYGNEFHCIPAEVPYRPEQLAKKPLVHGVQTAIVVGPEDEEIHTDEHGRVKVQFHWDREGKYDDNSSCWVRVNQNWAGQGFGSIIIPRIGFEVIVEFIEGNPDRPLIIGSTYHGTNCPPYPLPNEKTKSTLKTNSSKGGEGFNEIRLEDKKGEEQIFVHAEKDTDFRVKNDQREWIGNDRHLIVKRDKVQQVDRDEHNVVDRDQATKITRDMSVKLGGKQIIEVAGTRSVSVTGDVHESFKNNHSQEVGNELYLKGMNVVVEGMKELTVKVGGNFVKIDSSGVTIVGAKVNVNSGGSAGNGTLGSLVDHIVPLTSAIAATAVAATIVKYDRTSTMETHKDPQEDEIAEEKKWVEIELLDNNDLPVAGERYEVELPDGKIASGTTNAEGIARINGVDPGSCKIRFPEMHEDGWNTI